MAALQDQLAKANQQLAQRDQKLQEVARRIASSDRAHALTPIDGAEVKVYELKYAPAESVASAVTELMGEQTARIATDNRTNAVVVYGKPQSLPMIEALVARLDQRSTPDKKPVNEAEVDTTPLMLRVFWLADGLKGEGGDPSSVLPTNVCAAVEKLGLEEPAIVTQNVTTLSVGSDNPAEFATEIPALLLGKQVTLDLGGKLTLAASDRAALAMTAQVSGGGMNSQLKGSLSMRLGHYMVLGTSNLVVPDANNTAISPKGSGPQPLAVPAGAAPPVSRYNSSRFAFVVQVVPAESYSADDAKK
jgi:hypothetical protein